MLLRRLEAVVNSRSNAVLQAALLLTLGSVRILGSMDHSNCLRLLRRLHEAGIG